MVAVPSSFEGESSLTQRRPTFEPSLVRSTAPASCTSNCAEGTVNYLPFLSCQSPNLNSMCERITRDKIALRIHSEHVRAHKFASLGAYLPEA